MNTLINQLEGDGWRRLDTACQASRVLKEDAQGGTHSSAWGSS